MNDEEETRGLEELKDSELRLRQRNDALVRDCLNLNRRLEEMTTKAIAWESIVASVYANRAALPPSWRLMLDAIPEALRPSHEARVVAYRYGPEELGQGVFEYISARIARLRVEASDGGSEAAALTRLVTDIREGNPA